MYHASGPPPQNPSVDPEAEWCEGGDRDCQGPYFRVGNHSLCKDCIDSGEFWFCLDCRGSYRADANMDVCDNHSDFRAVCLACGEARILRNAIERDRKKGIKRKYKVLVHWEDPAVLTADEIENLLGEKTLVVLNEER